MLSANTNAVASSNSRSHNVPIEFSSIFAAKLWGAGDGFSAKGVNLYERGEQASPVAVLDDFRVNGRPFPPHPHAGFSALTYVFEDSEGGVRSRDSLGNDVVVGPGGIVWLQAARGALHQEVPAESGRELHGAQIFVNLSSKNKLAASRTLWLESSVVPEWQSEAGDRVRVVVGSYEGASSPLVPAEPFNLLDVTLRRAISFGLRNAHYGLVYVLEGGVLVRADGREQKLPGEHALALRGGGRVTVEAVEPAHFLILSGAEVREPVLVDGPFIMNERSQIEKAIARFRASEMGSLAPLA
jgi:redox-sensitive bicupin YhaK (pirin superfamily)